MISGKWNHIVGTFDNATKKGYLFSNGNQIAAGSLVGIAAANSYNVNFGKRAASDNLFFKGLIDDVRIYNRALSPDEVRQLSEWGPGPVGWWKMDESSGTTVYDSSGNGLNGSFSGSTPNWVRLSNFPVFRRIFRK